ncbi:hypothetical protein [Aquimarina sp. AD10]|uniref:hypothetical protein n=1 Tax=Aquimarina sp. AD10 TaxID=1714849 RepID=UPI001314CA29|nr:hypothetical protein [Aquimarina sp. AD10]
MLKGILNLEGTKELKRKELTTLKGGIIAYDGGPCNPLTAEYYPHCKEDESEDDKA